MKAKFTLIALTLLTVGSTSVLAGGGQRYTSSKSPVYSKNPVVSKNPVSTALCYDAGYEFGIFAAGFLPQNDGIYEEALGGGVSLGYFFNSNLGLDLGAAIYGTNSEVHNYTLDVVYRLPNQDACYAPYFFGGGGVHGNGETEALLRGGVGIDYKISDSSSVFADGAYNWVGGDVEEYITVRAGLRFNF